MKKSIIFLSLGALMLAATGCDSDYLNQTSVGADVDDSVIFNSLDNVKKAVNGIALLQTQRYSVPGCNGEGTLKTWFNEYTGQDYIKPAMYSWNTTMNLTLYNQTGRPQNFFAWQYCYMQIVNANRILNKIDEVPGNAHERNLYKAQTLVYRAYAYSNLVKYYSRRWSDKQGDCRGVILRLEPTSDPMPATSLKAVYAQIYDDLDLAIQLFTTSKQNGYDRAANEKYLPNIDVAYAVYSRAALNREDWSTALSMAENAMKNYSIMGIDDYKAGFNAPNNEWIWEAYNDASQTVFTYGFFAYNASNSGAANCYKYPIVINRELANQIPSNDTRLYLFGMPTDEELQEFDAMAQAGDGFNNNTGAVTKGKFFNRIKNDYKSRLSMEAGLETLIFPYMSFKYLTVAGSSGDGQLCLFRKAEMLYNAAEAAYMLNQAGKAQDYLAQAVEPYQEGYTCSKTGENLLNEIKLYRRFDLYGEGFSWFDCKRWGIPMVRHTWQEGGNWPYQLAGDASVPTNGNYGPDARNNWTLFYPIYETDFNDLVTPEEGDNWIEGK